MTEQEREELIEKMARAAWECDTLRKWEDISKWMQEGVRQDCRAALAVAEPVIREQVELELRVKNVCVYGTSHPEIYKTVEDDLREENARLRGEVDDLRATLRNCLTDANFMRAAAAAIREGRTGNE